MKRDPNDARTIKFEGFIYLPKDTGKPITWDHLRKMAMTLGNGRIMIFDQKGEPMTEYSKPFGNIGGMIDLLARAFTKRASKRIPTTAQLKRMRNDNN